jgi:hypothetical protein
VHTPVAAVIVAGQVDGFCGMQLGSLITCHPSVVVDTEVR